jgi:alpha-amylase
MKQSMWGVAGLVILLASCGLSEQIFMSEADVAMNDSGLNQSGSDIAYNGGETDVILQAFHWEAHEGAAGKSWYKYLDDNMSSTIDDYFNVVYLPPPAQTPGSHSPEGYIPVKWYDLNSEYGTRTELKNLINELHGSSVKVLADMVINHRGASSQCAHGDWIYFSSPSMNGNDHFLDGELSDTENNGDGEWSEGSFTQNGRTYNLSDFGPVPDLNHWKSGMRSMVKDWLSWLTDVDSEGWGFDGWRYDYSKGYDPYYLAEYNDNSNPYISMIELWENPDNRQQLADYINRSQNKTMALDFTTKSDLNDAFQSGSNFYGGALASSATASSSEVIQAGPLNIRSQAD